MLKFYHENGRNKASTIKHVQKIAGWAKISRTCLGRWAKAERDRGDGGIVPRTVKVKRKRGRRIQEDFERALFNRLVSVVATDSDTKARADFAKQPDDTDRKSALIEHALLTFAHPALT